MILPKNIQEKIAKGDYEGLNIIEEQIDLNLQMNYFKRSGMLKKHVVTFEDILEKVPLLYDPDARLEEQRDILVFLALLGNPESFRIIEKFRNDAVGELKLWAAMAYRECKMLLESSLLDEDQILISTGMGGKGTSLRYFIGFLHKNEIAFNEVETRILRGEFDSAMDKYGCEVESLEMSGCIFRATVLIPLDVVVSNVIKEIVEGCVEMGNFLSEKMIVTNVRALSSDEILAVAHGNMVEDDLFDVDSLDSSPYLALDDEASDEDYDEDEDDDDDDESDFDEGE